ncbi:MAG: MBL fold metallo-hydrolase [Victivallaceae bacterium]|nr:MBL fold metallo-hydrolase [Victivallaceae bacterium]
MSGRADPAREVVGLLEVNCYLVPAAASRRLYIIDPGAEAAAIIAAARKFSYEEAVILLTHAHVDHIGAVREVAKALGIGKIYLHPNDVGIYRSRNNHLLPYIPPAEQLPETTPAISGNDFEILEIPGHSPGSVGFYFSRLPALFAGDTIFKNSIGRSDLPGGNPEQLISSIKNKLMTLPDDLKLYPGHGPATTIGSERKFNPYL